MPHTCSVCSFKFEEFLVWLIHMNNHIDAREVDAAGIAPEICTNCGVKTMNGAMTLCSICRFDVIMTRAVSPTWLISALIVDGVMTAAAVERRHSTYGNKEAD